jgi:AcrR family transcriptional regulator
MRSRIAEAAMQVFSDKGYESAAVADLLEAAGVARRTFYRHFSSKEDVLLELYQMVTRALADEMAEVSTENQDRWSGTLRGLDVYLDFHVKNRKLLLTMLTEARRPSSPLYPLRQRYRQLLVHGLTLALEERAGRRYDPLVSEALFGSLDALSMLLLQGDAGPEARERVGAVIRGLLDLASRDDAPLPKKTSADP